MRWAKQRKVWLVILGIVGVLLAFVVVELLIVKFNGQNVPAPTIDRTQTMGIGTVTNYVVFGDSTSVGQGGDYDYGIAVGSAKYIAAETRVSLHNYGVSGARMHDVLTKQVPQMTEKPDIVLLSIGANDVTHFTRITSVKADMTKVIDSLRLKNPNVKIVITGAPAMGSIPRFPQPMRWAAGRRTATMNTMFVQLAKDQRIAMAPIAEKLGPTFAKNPRLFAKDNFHPNDEGYALWKPIITDALETVL